MEIIDIHDFKKKIDKINKKELEKKINFFDKIDLSTITDEELFEKIKGVLLIEGEKVSILTRIIPYKIGEKFYRIRAIKNIEDMQKISDVWEAPISCCTNYGRLNSIGESLLYTTQNIAVAINEMKDSLVEGKEFCLIEYIVKKEFEILEINTSIDSLKDELNGEQLEKIELILKFFYGQFGKRVIRGQEKLYRISNIIAKNFYRLHDNQVGWKYISIETKESVGIENDNICFVPEKIKNNNKIAVNRVHIVKYENMVNKGSKLTEINGSFEIDENGKLVYHSENKMRKKIKESFESGRVLSDSDIQLKLEKELSFYADTTKWLLYENLIINYLFYIKKNLGNINIIKKTKEMINFYAYKCLNLKLDEDLVKKLENVEKYNFLIKNLENIEDLSWIDIFLEKHCN